MSMHVLDATLYDNIQGALRTGLTLVPGVPDDAHMIDENRNFEPTEGDVWLGWTFFPQPNRPVSISHPQTVIRHFGAVIIDYYVARNRGSKEADDFASAVVAMYLRRASPFIYNGQLVTIRNAFATRGMNIDQFYTRSITVGWQADTVTNT